MLPSNVNKKFTFANIVEVIVVVLALVLCFYPSKPNYGPAPNNQHPKMARLAHLAKWLGWAAIFADDKPDEAESVAPDESTIAKLPMETKPFNPEENCVQIDHGKGW